MLALIVHHPDWPDWQRLAKHWKNRLVIHDPDLTVAELHLEALDVAAIRAPERCLIVESRAVCCYPESFGMALDYLDWYEGQHPLINFAEPELDGDAEFLARHHAVAAGRWDYYLARLTTSLAYAPAPWILHHLNRALWRFENKGLKPRTPIHRLITIAAKTGVFHVNPPLFGHRPAEESDAFVMKMLANGALGVDDPSLTLEDVPDPHLTRQQRIKGTKE